MDQIREAPPGTFRLRNDDLSGLDYAPLPPPPPEDEVEEGEEKKGEPEGKKTEPEPGEKSGKTH